MIMKIKKCIILSVLLIGASIIALFYAVRYPQFFFGKGRQEIITVHFPTPTIDIAVEVARTPYQWSRGLMFREVLPDQTGMLFVFPDLAERSFWMKNTLIPLDMLFIDEHKKIVTIVKNAVPCTTLMCPQYTSSTPAMYVLEVNTGFVDMYNLKEGDVVEFGM